MKGYGPADPLQTPRFAGISTFLRLPHTTHLDGVDVAFVGLPFDTGVSFRAGARFGPKAIREGSLALHPDYNPAQRVALFERLSAIDYGDAPIVPGFTDRSYDKMSAALRVVHEAGAVPIGFGGDHSVLLAELRAAAPLTAPSPSSSSTRTATPGTSTSARSSRTARSCAAPPRRGWSTPRVPR